MKYARIIDNVAIETFVPQEGFTIQESFHPDVASLFVAVPDDVTTNSTINSDGTWNIYVHVETEYAPEQPAEGEQQVAPDVSA